MFWALMYASMADGQFLLDELVSTAHGHYADCVCVCVCVCVCDHLIVSIYGLG